MLLERTLKTSLILTMALAPLACGDDEPDPTPIPTPELGDIVQVASANSDFSTLVSAIQAGGLVDTLKGAGPFTVFAPTNAAFAALPAGTLEALLADQAELRKVLTYHVVPGKVTAAQVVTLSEATTVEGSKLDIEVRSGSVFLNGTIKVTMTDIAAKNGVIHVIDAVLTPPEPAPGTIVDIAAGNPDFSTLVAALQAANLDDTLAGAGPFTVFAPTNAAFAALPAGTVDALLADIPELTKVLTYHVVAGKVEAAQVVTLTEATTVEGSKITIEVRNGEVFLNGTVKVTMTDIQASNGVIHVIDAVLLPPAAPQTITEIAAGNPDFSILVSALTRANLVTTLSGAGPFTVFAPTNAAFAASGLNQAAVDALPVPELTQILTYHVLGAEVASGAITAGPQTTVANLTLFLGTTGGVRINGGNAITGGANVVTADIDASNGVIHVIDRVLLPPNIPTLATYGGLTTLVSAVTTANLGTALSAAGPFTVFAPTNAAFAALPALPTGADLERVLLYHAVNGSVLSTGVPASAPALATNTYGDNLTLLFDTSAGVVINAGPSVVIADLRATNGIVHVVDEVILPMNVVDAATAAGLTGLLGAVGAAAPLPSSGPTVAAALAAQAPYTVFAPNNAAFTAAAATIATLTPAQIRDVLLYHVLDTTAFPAPILAADLPAAVTSLATLNGQTVSLDPTVNPPTIGGSDIIATDIVVTNGVIHLIDGVMVPPNL
ncbi:MAG: fasciclin domain-containing protein [Deltaproteobacteria bacterium]|nr:fasciclin domain-containing protein [Deltaproteobacteria bacterium]